MEQQSLNLESQGTETKQETSSDDRLKKCDTCREHLEYTEFYFNKYKHDGYSSTCKTCHNGNAQRKRAYYNRLVAEQSGRCAICGITTQENNKAFAVDHCHTTGKIRGALCNNCNTGIGNFLDSEELLNKAIEYLRLHNEETST